MTGPKLIYLLILDSKHDGEEEIKTFVRSIKAFLNPAVIASLIIFILYGISCILMMIGAKSSKPSELMIPYMVLQFFFIMISLTTTLFLNLTIFIITHYPIIPTCILFSLFMLPYYIVTIKKEDSLKWFWPSAGLVTFVINSIVMFDIPYQHTCLILLLFVVNFLNFPMVMSLVVVLKIFIGPK